jgi:hypothetical protein
VGFAGIREGLIMAARVPDVPTNTGDTVIRVVTELPELFEMFPTRQKIEAKDVPSIKPAELPRVGGLLPAVYVDPLVFTTANRL